MPVLLTEVLKDRAIAYCIAYVFSWDALTEEQQAHYIKKTMALLSEHPEVQKQLFAQLLN